MKNITVHQRIILIRLNASKTARIKHDPVLKSYDLIDGAYRENLKPITFWAIYAYLELAEQVGLSLYYRLGSLPKD